MTEDDVQHIKNVSDRMAVTNGIGLFSTAERIAGAIVNNRLDWLPGGSSEWHIADALGRLGSGWVSAALEVRSRNWNGRWQRSVGLEYRSADFQRCGIRHADIVVRYSPGAFTSLVLDQDGDYLGTGLKESEA